jgi:hypothetical protein
MKQPHGVIEDGFKTIKMAICSTELDELSPVRQLLHMSHAYLDCSEYLLKAIDQDHVSSTFSHARATSFLFEHSLELFFKAGIFAQRGKIDDTHDLSKLLKDFLSIYPEAEPSFHSNIRALTEKDSHRPFGQYSKYPIDKDGWPWTRGSVLVIEHALSWIALLRDDFRRLTHLVEEKEDSQQGH